MTRSTKEVSSEMATIVRWEPFRELAAFQNEMSRWMNGLLEGNGQATQAWVPAVDVWETEAELVYAFDLPGIPQDAVNIEYDDGALTVSAERRRETELKEDRFYRFERRFGTFSRTIALPQGVSEEAVSADLKDGVLEVHVRKPEETKPRRIQVGGTAPKTIEGSATPSS
jgi:HSP20 family protein